MINILKRYPTITSILLFCFTMVIPWALLYPLLNKMPYYFGFFTKYMITFILSIGASILLYKKIPFTLKCPSYFKGLITFGLVGLICVVFAFVCSMCPFDRQTNYLEVFSFVLYVIAIVLGEEILFRGIILFLLLDRYGKNKNGVLISILISSIFLD